MLARIQEENPENIRIVYRHFPLLSIHQNAGLATQAAEAAGIQGKFWEMHDLLFERQAEWSGIPMEEFQAWLEDRATDLGLDREKFTQHMLSEQIAAIAQSSWDMGNQIGLQWTPFLLINDQPWRRDIPLSHGNLSTVIALTLLEKRQFSECPPMEIDPSKEYIATLHLERGDIIMELYADKSPIAVNNFVFLARNGWFDGVTFHRVLPGYIAQTGDPTGTGFGGPGYAFMNETSPDLNFDREGLVAMANSGPNSNGSQFFITYAPAPNLDGGYTIFGRVIAGMDVAKNIRARDPSTSSELPPGDKIKGVTIEVR